MNQTCITFKTQPLGSNPQLVENLTCITGVHIVVMSVRETNRETNNSHTCSQQDGLSHTIVAFLPAKVNIALILECFLVWPEA